MDNNIQEKYNEIAEALYIVFPNSKVSIRFKQSNMVSVFRFETLYKGKHFNYEYAITKYDAEQIGFWQYFRDRALREIQTKYVDFVISVNKGEVYEIQGFY